MVIDEANGEGGQRGGTHSAGKWREREKERRTSWTETKKRGGTGRHGTGTRSGTEAGNEEEDREGDDEAPQIVFCPVDDGVAETGGGDETKKETRKGVKCSIWVV